MKLRIEQARFEPSLDPGLEARVVALAYQLVAERLEATRARLVAGAKGQVPTLGVDLPVTLDAARTGPAGERAAAGALADRIWASLEPLLEKDGDVARGLLALGDRAFFDAIKEWDGPTFSRLLYDGTKKKVRDRDLHDRYLGLLKRINERMNSALASATHEAVDGAPKSVDGIWKKLVVDRIPTLELVGDAVRGRINLVRHSGRTVEEQLTAISSEFDRPDQRVEFKYRDMNIDREREDYRGRVNVNGIRDPETRMRYELQYGARNVSLFYDGEERPGHLEVFIEAKPGERMPVHDAMYKGADKLAEIVRGKPAKGVKPAVSGIALSAEDRAHFEEVYRAVQDAYFRALDDVIQTFRTGELLTVAQMQEVCRRSGLQERAFAFFNDPVVLGIVREHGDRIEGKVRHHLPS